MEKNTFGPLLRYLRFIEEWVDSIVKDVKVYTNEHSRDQDMDVLSFDCEIFDAASKEMLEHITSFRSIDQQTKTVNILAALMGSTYVMGRWQGSTERVSGSTKTQADHLADIRAKLSPFSDIKLAVAKELVADLWGREPKFIDNVLGTSTVILERANTAMKLRWWKLDEDQRKVEPVEDIKIRTMQKWVKRAVEELREEGRFARL